MSDPETNFGSLLMLLTGTASIAIAGWYYFKGREKIPLSESKYNISYPHLTENEISIRNSYMDTDSVDYEIDVSFEEECVITTKVKISFIIKKRVDNFKPLSLDCITLRRASAIAINSKKVSTDSHDYGRI